MRYFGATGSKQGKFEKPVWSDSDEDRDAHRAMEEVVEILKAIIATQEGSGGGAGPVDDGPAEGERSPLSYQPQSQTIRRRVRPTQDLSRYNPYASPVHYSRDYRPIHMYAQPAYGSAYGGWGTTLALSGTMMVAAASAGVINWNRNPELKGVKRFLKAWGASIIWLPYLVYVGIEKMKGE